MSKNPNPWVIVENAGQDNENEVADFKNFLMAHRFCLRNYYDDELESLNVQIMKRQDDGTLTTEF